AMIKRHVLGSYVIEDYIDEDESSGEVSEPEEPEPFFDDGFEIEYETAELPYDPETGRYHTPVSFGKTYTTSPPPDTNYPDTYNAELTDGMYGEDTPFYTNEAYCGFGKRQTVKITVDLGSSATKLYEFELSYLSTVDAGINIPNSIEVGGSNDNSNYISLGYMTIPAFQYDRGMRAVLTCDREYDYRYIRFTVVPKDYWVFIDEVTVYADVESSAQASAVRAPVVSYNRSPVSDSAISSAVSAASNGKEYDPANGSTLVSRSRSYTFSGASYDSRAPYDSTKLTNGNDEYANFESGQFIGVSSSTASNLTFNFGWLQTDLYAFELRAFNRINSNVYLPAYVDVSVGSATDSLITVGRVYGIMTAQENYTYRLTIPYLTDAQYVRFNFPSGESNGYYWFDEISIYANYSVNKQTNYLYGSFDFPMTAVENYWPNTYDYNTSKNLISGMKTQVLCDVAVNTDVLTNYNPVNAETTSLLTDGVKDSNASPYNGRWVMFGYGKGRRFFYDLSAISTVTSASVHVLDYNSYSSGHASRIEVLVSVDGENWYRAGEVSPTHTDGVYVSTQNVSFASPVRARYVCVHVVMSDMRIYIGEITVTGKKNVSGVQTPEQLGLANVNPYPESAPASYLEPNDTVLSGVGDIMLIYHNSSIPINAEMILPYIGYIDESGNVVDTMADGFLFLPCVAALPSGGYPYSTNIYSDWLYLYNNLLGDNGCLKKVDKAAEKVKKQLGLDELHLKIYIAIPHLDTTLRDFGDVDGDGVSENLKNMSDRIKVVTAYVELCRQGFYSRDFKHLDLCGFYWFHEAIGSADIATAQAVNGAIEEQGFSLFWIPYYEAEGYTRWDYFGFQAGCLQPNYAFELSVAKSRLAEAAEIASIYDMCIEIEIPPEALSDYRFFKKYMNYMYYGAKCGYINGIHMYYQAVNVFYKAAYSDDPHRRMIYDYTYQFIKRDLKLEPTVNKDSYRFKAEYINCAMKGSVDKTGRAGSIYRVERSPLHGSVAMNEDGTFTYYPNNGFRGIDTFTFRVSDHMDWSEECTVSVYVGVDE
ncbi:MAG: DUF4855 domain-containing protein, partial [Clostridia bacterium]|nr:DUF4855 domain-containing protein [Clostridia bacterium]